MPKIFAVASVKGGVGKTTTAANLAATLAAAGYQTVAVDADLGSATLGATLGVEPGEVTLHDVLAGEADPPEASYEGPHGLAVLPGGQTLDDFRKADPSEIVGVLESITGADFVIVDTGAGLTHQTALPLSVADGVLLVSTPTRDGLVNTRKTQDLTAKLGGEVVGIALNQAEGDEDTGDVDVPVLGAIPDDPVIEAAQAAGVPVSMHAPDSDAAAAYRSLASSLTGKPIRAAPTPEQSESTPDDPEYEADADAADAADDTPVPESADEDSLAELSGDDTDQHDTAEEGDITTGDEDETGDEDLPPEEDDAVILEDDEDADSEEDAAAAAARGTVLDEEEYAEFRDGSDEGAGDAVGDDASEDTEDGDAVGDDASEDTEDGDAADDAGKDTEPNGDGTDDDAVTIAEAESESEESSEIADDVIPFAQQGKERTEEAKQTEEPDDDDEQSKKNDGGFLGRLFR
ncbi:MinD/ParA family ATP-binding protein [Halobaculum limi]|uniref:MinD/ParA family ATP-binding protein n=1 Tax=Halobaculum limi TaxID=3031916 RepID=UPI00240508CF|nr:P-loop NTPase [Halobaculum sp. YSMS11]